MYNILSICLEPNKLEIIRIIRLIIDLIRIIIPIILIINVMYYFINNFLKLKDLEVQKTFKKVLKNSFISLSIYFIPLIIIFIINVSFPEYKNCTKVNLNIIENVYVNKIENSLSLLSDDLNYNEFNKTKGLVSKLRNEEEKTKYNNELNIIKSKIDSNIYFKSNYMTNIYMGDSRTELLVEEVDENEIIVARSGARLNHFLTHAEKTKEILNKNKGKTYNIILNYGVNDLNNAYGYCAAYTNFINEIGKSHNIYLMSVNPVNDETKLRKTSDVLKFNDIIKTCMSKVENLTYCDVYNSVTHQEWLDKYLSKDGVHFNALGDEYIHNQVLSCIK